MTDVIDADVERARHLVGLGRVHEAEPILRRVLAAEPDHHRALLTLEWLLRWAERYEEAAGLAARLIAMFPDDSSGYLAMAWARNRQDREIEAEPFAREAVRLDPHSPETLLALATALTGLKGRREEALTIVGQAIERDPDGAAGHFARAWVFISLLRWEEAERATLEAVAHAPHDPDYRIWLGIIRLRLGRQEEALADIQAALRMPGRIPVRTLQSLRTRLEWLGVPEPVADTYSLILTATGSPDLRIPGAAGTDPALLQEQADVATRLFAARVYDAPTQGLAEELIDAVLTADPRQPTARRLAAEAAAERKDQVTALRLAEGLRDDGYDDAAVLTLIVDALISLGHDEEALQAVRAAATRHPEDARFPAQEAEILNGLARHAEAVAAAQRAVDMDPDDMSHRVALARSLAEAGRIEDARKNYEDIVRLAPDRYDARFSLGRLLLDAYNDPRRAERELALVNVPDWIGPKARAGARAALATARARLGDFEAAEADLRACLADCPDDADMRTSVTDIMLESGVPDPFTALYRYVTGKPRPGLRDRLRGRALRLARTMRQARPENHGPA